MIAVFAVNVAVLIAVGVLAQEWGFTSTIISIDAPGGPPSGNFLTAILSVVSWVFNTVGSIFQLMFFQVTGLHPMFSLITLFFAFLTFYIGFRLVRGGG